MPDYRQPNKKFTKKYDKTKAKNSSAPKYEPVKEVRFVNPYQFIHVEKNNGLRKVVREEDARFSGKLVCHLTTRTPLAIPDIETVTFDENKHPTYHFYQIDGTPTIPGSSIRGSIRSVYETVTDSCFSTMPKEEFISARLNAKVSNPGILIKNEKGEWCLYEADRMKLPLSGNSFSEKIKENGERVLLYQNQSFALGDEVKVVCDYDNMVSHMEKREGSGYYVYIGEPFMRKKSESVFRKKGKKPLAIPVAEMNKAINGLVYSIEQYRNPAINRNLGKGVASHQGYMGFDRCYKQGCIPVWYRLDNANEEFVLSMAAIGRNVYKNTVNDLVGKYYESCVDRKKTCPACTLFGMTGIESRGSKIRFSDAKALSSKTLAHQELKELSSPRPGYYLFYGLNGVEYDRPGAGINGRKYYWHIPEAAKNPKVYRRNADDKLNERNATMDLVYDAEFEFTVYFDEITQEQLDTLKWALCLGENWSESKLCHKIGHGKPIGLGSAKITILQENKRRYTEQDGYIIDSSIPSEKISASDSCNKIAMKDLKIICDLDYMEGETVRYPYIEIPEGQSFKKNDTANHKWFSENKKEKREKQHLEGVAEEIPNLYPYKISAPVQTGDNQGTVKRIMRDKGFGFIQCAGEDIYFNSRGLAGGLSIESLKEGDHVIFTKEKGAKGPVAKNVAK